VRTRPWPSTAEGAESGSLTPHRAVGDVARDVPAAVRRLVGAVEINPTPQELARQIPLVEDVEHASAPGGWDEVVAGSIDGEPPPPLRQN
jgi:hypothetical protein